MVNATLHAGDLLLIEGPNGSGKTTLVRALLERSGLTGFVYLPQMGNVRFFLPLSVADVIRLVVPATDEQILEIGLLGSSSLSRPWNTASGGERQKALLTRLFLRQERILVLDEPFNHLDRKSRVQAVRLIARARVDGRAVILITHEQSDLELSGVERIVLEGLGDAGG